MMILFLLLFFFLSIIDYNVTSFLVVYIYFLSVGSFGEGPHHKISLCFSEGKKESPGEGGEFSYSPTFFPLTFKYLYSPCILIFP